MNEFYNEIVETTKANFGTKKANDQKNFQEKCNRMKSIIEHICNEVSNSNYKEVIKSVAENGLHRVTIYTFESEPSEEYSMNFLWNGPTFNRFNTGVGLRYFQNLSIIPLQYLLQQSFNPFKVFYYFDTKAEKHKIDVIW